VTTPGLRASPLTAGDCLGYARVSKEDQAAENKTSLNDQRTAIMALAARLGRQLSSALIFEDPGVSGATAEDRPGFMALVRHCEAHPRPRSAPGFVLALNDSRWGRFSDAEEATFWRVRLKNCGWRVRFAEGDETEDPTARSVLRAIYSSQASLYRENIRANAKRGAEGAARRGLWQNEAPIGYRRRARDPITDQERTLERGQLKGKNEEVRLTLGPQQEQQVVQSIFARYAGGGVSLGALARELDRTFPGRAWSKQTVRAVLKNPAYVGDVVWCRRPHDKAERREHWIRPEADWVVTRDAHPALVSRDMFAAVQERLVGNKRQTRATAGGYPLSGLLRCAQCGESYTGGGGPQGPPDDPDRYRFYKDRGGVGRAPVCSGPLGTLQKRWIEPRIIATVADVVSRPDVRRLIAEECDRQLSDLRSVHTGGRAALERERKRLNTERERLVAAIAHGTVTEAEAAVQIAGSRTALDRIAADLERLRFDDRRSTRLDGEREQLVALAADFATVARRASGAQLREILRPWIADAVVDKANRKLTLTIRRVPLAGVFLQLSAAPGRGSP